MQTANAKHRFIDELKRKVPAPSIADLWRRFIS